MKNLKIYILHLTKFFFRNFVSKTVLCLKQNHLYLTNVSYTVRNLSIKLPLHVMEYIHLKSSNFYLNFNTQPTARAAGNCQNGKISPIGRLSVNTYVYIF